MFLYMYIALGQGQTAPWGQININLLWLWSFAVSFFHYMTFWQFSPCKSIRDQTWPCRKIGQGQLRTAQGPNASYQATRSLAFWFWRRRILKGFTIYGRGGHLGHVTQTPRTNFRSPIPLRLHKKFGFDWPSGFWEEDLWKWWTDGQRTDDGAWLYYKLTNEPKGSGDIT